MRKSLLVHLAATSLVLSPIAAHAALSQAAKSAARADRALEKGKPGSAVDEAEAAVAAAPADASYRMLLGRAYLSNGRFGSAATSFADALSLDPTRGTAALNLALAQLGLGNKDGALATLERHGGLISDGDRGLALALAGSSAGVSVLEAAVRNGGADAKTRQNLALAYALAGRWSESKLMASYDLDPATVSQRIMDWSRFARDGQANAQVAALLGVQPGDDAGLPTRLALNAPVAPDVRLAESMPPPPVKMADGATVEVATVVAEAKALFTPASGIVFAPRSEIVQAIKVPAKVQTVAQVRSIVGASRSSFARPTGGNHVVQIGAFDSMGVAQNAWGRAVSRVAGLDALSPSTMKITVGASTFYRLSVGGFANRGTAVDFCEQFRTRGGQCFVRQAAGDTPLIWAGRSSGTRFASR